jgi:hypothetical protein
MKNYLGDVAPGWDDRMRHSLRVGLMWAANPALFDWRSARRGRKKTIPANVLGDLSRVKDTTFISLQSRQSAEQAAHVPHIDIIDCSQMLDTMADTAALMEQVDVVVTVDTSVAHMAGALGKKTFVMLAHDSDWRWMLDRKDSLWYKDVTCFRQPVDGDWQSVINEITVQLQALTPRGIPVQTVRGDFDTKPLKPTPSSKKKARNRNA